MIQLTTADHKVLYELPKSDLFPDYISVLKEAIKLQVDLSGLFIDSKDISNVKWQSLDFTKITIHNSIITNNSFIECKGSLDCVSCKSDRLKIKRSQLSFCNFEDCNLSNMSYSKSESENVYFRNCSLNNALFTENILNTFHFNNCQLPNCRFYSCNMSNIHFSNKKNNKEWYKNLSFINCEFNESKFENDIDVSELMLWDINYDNLDFNNDVKFVDITNTKSKVIVSCFSETIWWLPYNDITVEKLPYRHSFKSFKEEVNARFPTTDVYPEMTDLEIEDELLAVCEYLKYWKKRNRSFFQNNKLINQIKNYCK